MQKTPFIWLGSGRVRKRGIGQAGRYLDEAASARLPVPAGAILLDEFYRFLQAEAVVVVEDDRLTVPDPTMLHDALFVAARFPRMKVPVVVRTAFSRAGENVLAQAGEFVQSPVFDLNNPVELASALTRAWTSALSWEQGGGSVASSLRWDLLLTERVKVEVYGESSCQHNANVDLVKYWSKEEDGVLRLPKLHRWRRPDAGLPPFGQRLQRLLRGIQRTFGRREWQIEWVDDGRICWLTQIQPLIVPPSED